MVSNPMAIPTVLRSWIQRKQTQRKQAQRMYNALLDERDETLDALRTTFNPHERAELLDAAAGFTEHLSMLHTAAWGLEPDTEGRLMGKSLHDQAVLLREVAKAERMASLRARGGVTAETEIGDRQDHLGAGDDPEVAEWLTWGLLSSTAEPAQRAVHLRRLRDLTAVYRGDRAAEVLGLLARLEERRAAGLTRRDLPGWWFWGARIAIGVFFVALGVVLTVPGLGDDTRDVLTVALLGVMAVFFGGLWLVTRGGGPR